VPGVVRTRVGYAGGDKLNPTYYDLGDHTETLEVDFDPSVVTYEELLELYWTQHAPTRAAFSAQYKAAVYYHNDGQKKLAETTRARWAQDHNAQLKDVTTEIIPHKTFYLAEDYHQKYGLRQNGALLGVVQAYYPDADDFVNSTLAARLNGYAYGNGSVELFETEADSYGLPNDARWRLEDIVKMYSSR